MFQEFSGGTLDQIAIGCRLQYASVSERPSTATAGARSRSRTVICIQSQSDLNARLIKVFRILRAGQSRAKNRALTLSKPRSYNRGLT